MRQPDLRGPAASAWRILTPEAPACVSAWLIEHPTAHVAWTRWLLSVVHLRELPGFPPVERGDPGVTHELMIAALDPKTYDDHAALIEGTGERAPLGYLTPFDVVEQFRVPTDTRAVSVAHAAVLIIVTGQLLPDQDCRSAWCETIQEMAAEMRALN